MDMYMYVNHAVAGVKAINFILEVRRCIQKS